MTYLEVPRPPVRVRTVKFGCDPKTCPYCAPFLPRSYESTVRSIQRYREGQR